jgi:hypothetical protein
MKRKAFEEIPGPSTKKGRRYPEPIHERRLFVKATVMWTSLKGEIKTHEGMFLADSRMLWGYDEQNCRKS